MKKNDVFTFTAPNGAEVVAVCLKSMGTVGNMTQYLCYGQNRLFTMNEFYSEWTEETGKVCQESQTCYGEILVDHAILPDYDAALEMAGFDEEEADILFERDSHAQAINKVKAMGYNEKEAINILEGKNADGSNFEELPF